MIEEWKEIAGFDGAYQISNLGRVKSVERINVYQNTNQTGVIFDGIKYCEEKILKTYVYGGYEHIGLKKGGRTYNYSVHRLVATYFIPNPNNYPVINHKDENKFNNKVDNLEWCTVEYNANYGTRNARIAEKLKEYPIFYIPVLCYDKDNNFVKRYESAVQAGQELGFSASRITACCRLYKGAFTAGGYKWKYEDSDNNIKDIIPPLLKKEIHQFDLEGNYITTYESLSDAARALGKDVQNFNGAVRKGKAYGYLWIFIDNQKDINDLVNEIYEKEHHIYQIDSNGEVVNRFTTGLEAEKITGIGHSNISRAMLDKTKEGKFFRKIGGYYWVDINNDPSYEIDFNFKKGHGEIKVVQYTLSGKELNKFNSIADAQEYLGMPRDKISAIYDCFKKNSTKKTAYGFIWRKE